jgi:hypothetical protein
MGHSEAILERFLYPSKEDKSVEMWRYCRDTGLILVCLPEHAELQKAQEMNVEADSIVSIICQPASSSAEKRRKFARDIYFQQWNYSLMLEGKKAL